jgi:hypothetical protein
MSTIEVNKITPVSGGTTVQVGESGDTINIPAGATIANAGTSTGFGDSLRPNAQALIINGNMNVWQRSTSTVTMSDGYYNVDRFRGEEDTDGTATWSRSTSVPDNTGLPYSLQVDCTGTDSSIGSSQQINIQQTIEAQNLQLLKWGTSDAEKVTLAFWVKSNQTGQHSVSFRKLDNTAYNQPKTYTINSANTWEKKVLVFSALTLSGGAIANDNGDGLQLFWKLAAGSSYQGTADTWTATNQGATAVSGDVNFMSSTDNNWYLTGVQLEVGEYTSSTIPPFQHESFGDNKERCMRYYQNSYKLGNALTSTSGNNAIIVTSWNDGNCPFPNMFPVPMRDAPTVTLRPRGSTTVGQINSNGTDRSATATDVSEKGVSYLTVTSGTALTYSGFTFELEAEL